MSTVDLSSGLVHMQLLHDLLGVALILGAVLAVAAAGPRHRSRILAIFVAVLVIGVVTTGCSPATAVSAAAAADTGAAGSAAGPPSGRGLVVLLVVGLAVALFAAAVRVFLAVLGLVLRALELIVALREAALLMGVLTVATLIAAATV